MNLRPAQTLGKKDTHTKIFNFGSLLIENLKNEDEVQFRENITNLLTGMYGELPEWLKFKVGRKFERQGVIYREFLCAAGSVDSRIQLHAQQPRGIPRMLILRGMRAGVAYCSEIRAGVETEFDCNDLNEVAK